MGLKIGGQIEKVNGKELSYTEFEERYLKKNQAVVVTGLMDNWRACKDWVTNNGQPNLQFFSTHFGKSKVQVADCGARDFTDQKRVEMSVSEFVDHWLKDSAQERSASTHESSRKPLLYLKDWHFVKEYPDYIAYRTPLFFCDDWLNLYLNNHRMHKDPEPYQENNDISCADYRFVYMGAKGSWTPLHADVFRSYSWSANVCGKKHWLFLTPSQCHLVFDRNMRNCVYDIFDDVSESEFPGFKKAVWLECIQEQNDIIFVPSGWYHQVHNLEDTISINHNWFNAFNLSWVWDLLLRDYNEAKEYIEDIRHICDDFESICQRNLAANTGMNFYDFFIFVTRFTIALLVQLYCLGDHESLLWNSSPVARHLVLNLISIHKIAMKMNSVEGLAGQHDLFLDLRETLKDPEFHKLCEALGRTYGMIHEQHDRRFDKKKVLMEHFGVMDFVETGSSKIYTPEDLIKLVDLSVQNISGICSEKEIWLSKMDEAQLYSEN